MTTASMWTITAYDLNGFPSTLYRDTRDEADELAKRLIDQPYIESVAVLPPHPVTA
jgi:hypothetical protein